MLEFAGEEELIPEWCLPYHQWSEERLGREIYLITKTVADCAETDCRKLIKVAKEFREHKLWEKFSDTWDEFCKEFFGRSAEWISILETGLSLLEEGDSVQEKDVLTKARQANAIQCAQKADPTLERKDGGNNNPYGRLGKPTQSENHRYNYNGDSDEPSTRGTSPTYLAQRIAEESPEIHEAMKQGKYPSVWAAARDAGVVKPRQTFSVGKTTQPKSLAKSLHDRLPPDFLEQLYQELGDLLTSDRQD